MALGAADRHKILVSRAIHPNYRAVLRTYCDGLDVTVDEIPFDENGTTDLAALARAVEGKEYAAAALSLAAFAPPSSWGAQIVAGEAQSFGVAQAYGGPYAGFIASTQEHLRRIPGRL